MAQLWIPGRSPIARAARGWPSSPDVKPSIQLKPKKRLESPSALYFAEQAGFRNVYTDDFIQSSTLTRTRNKVDFDGSTSLVGIPDDPGLGLTSFTVGVEFEIDTLPSVVSYIFNAWGNATIERAWLLDFRPNGEISWGVHNNGSAFIKRTAAGVLEAGKRYTVSASWKEGVSLLSVNGKSVSMPTDIFVEGNVSSISPTSKTCIFGRYADDLLYWFDGKVGSFFHTKEYLNQSALNALTRDYYGSLFKPANDTPFSIEYGASTAPVLSSITATDITTSSTVPTANLVLP